MTHLAVLRAFGGRPPVGVTLFVEGEEESGSPTLPALLREHRDALTCDVIVIADSAQPGRRRARADDEPARAGGRGRSRSRCWSARRTPACSAARSATRSPRCAARWRACTTSTATSPSPASSPARPTRPTSTRPRSAPTPALLSGVALIGTGTIVERTWTKPGRRRARHRRPADRRGGQHPLPRARAMVSLRLGPRRRRHHRAEGARRAPGGARPVGRPRHGDPGHGHRRAVLPRHDAVPPTTSPAAPSREAYGNARRRGRHRRVDPVHRRVRAHVPGRGGARHGRR